jgi:hypothetical protein
MALIIYNRDRSNILVPSLMYGPSKPINRNEQSHFSLELSEPERSSSFAVRNYTFTD